MIANCSIDEYVDHETPETSENGASKNEISDFDVWNVAYEIYCAGGYVDDGNEPNPPTDGIRELLNRQAAITERETLHSHPMCRDCKYYEEITYKWTNDWTRVKTTCALFDGCSVEPDGFCAWGEKKV